MPLTIATQADRRQRISALLDRLLPILDDFGLPFGIKGRRLVRVPWSITLRSAQPDILEIALGNRIFLAAELGNDTASVSHFACGDWDKALLRALPEPTTKP